MPGASRRAASWPPPLAPCCSRTPVRRSRRVCACKASPGLPPKRDRRRVSPATGSRCLRTAEQEACGADKSPCLESELVVRGPRRPRADESFFSLHPSQYLFPVLVAHVLEGNGQRLIEIDCVFEKIDCALRLPLPQALLAEPGAERQHFQRA